MQAQVDARLNFEFSDPSKGFDRTRVKGMVARLVKVKDKQTACALEISAGAKLYQVVVDTEVTGKALLQNGKLRKRVTILPLNKLSARCTEAARVSAAKKIAAERGGSAHLALELVGYDAEVETAMQFVFGNTLVCDRADVAEAIAFDPRVKNRTVTLEGDTYDPSGTLTGGSKSSLGDLLARLAKLQSLGQQLFEMEAELTKASQQLDAVETEGARAKELEAALDLQRTALRNCEDNMRESSYGQVSEAITAKESELRALQEAATALKKDFEAARAELLHLQKGAADEKKSRQAAMKRMEAGVKAAQKQAAQKKSVAAAARKQANTQKADTEALQRELETLRAQMQSGEGAQSTKGEEVEALERAAEEAAQAYDEARKSLAAKEDDLKAMTRELRAIETGKADAVKAACAAGHELKKVVAKLKAWDTESRAAERKLVALVDANPWIESEKTGFGQAGGDYDFDARDMAAERKELTTLRGAQEQLSRKINKKVVGMIEKAEAECDGLLHKRSVIEGDKGKIEEVIAELQRKKVEAVEETWTKVTRDFGSIFSTLLPGTTAKLEPPEGCAVTEGLEVKVAFNGVWKQSLTELSGGQRSLLALSLILSLLLFKPAPMYILDEVDAALDLSHTQNIGLMLRTHFSSSQFIVVSLKEGMFNNANVIFRTRFVDGVSTVSRTITGGRADAIANVPESEADVPKKKRGKAVGTKAAKATGTKGKARAGENIIPNIV